MFWSRAHEALIVSQRAEITDLRSALREEREAFAAERKDLLDRIIALSQPAAHRELHPRPPREIDLLKAAAQAHRPKRLHFPGTGKQSFPVPQEFVPQGPLEPPQAATDEEPSS